MLRTLLPGDRGMQGKPAQVSSRAEATRTEGASPEPVATSSSSTPCQATRGGAEPPFSSRSETATGRGERTAGLRRGEAGGSGGRGRCQLAPTDAPTSVSTSGSAGNCYASCGPAGTRASVRPVAASSPSPASAGGRGSARIPVGSGSATTGSPTPRGATCVAHPGHLQGLDQRGNGNSPASRSPG